MTAGYYKKILITFIIVGSVLFLGAIQSAGATCICNGSSYNYSDFTSQSGCESMCGSAGVATWKAPLQGCEKCPSNCAPDPEISGFGYCPASQPENSPVANSNECPSGCTWDPEGRECFCEEKLKTTGSVPCVFCGNTSVTHILLNGEDVGCYTDANGDWCAVGTGKGGSSGSSGSGTQTNTNQLDKGDSSIFDRLGIKSIFIGGPDRVSLLPTGAKNMSDAILKILDFIITLAIPFAVLAVIWAGFLFVTAQGNEEKIGKARQNLLWTIIGVAIILASKAIVGYIGDLVAGGGGQTSSLFDKIRTTLNIVVELLFIMATVYFFWGVIAYVKSAGDEKALKTGKQHMIWGIIGMALMLGAWTLVNVIANYIN